MRAFLATISRNEWGFVLKFSVLAVALASLPLVVIVSLTPPGYFATGLHTLSPGDYPVYYSYIDQAARGAFLFTDLFTAEPHAPFNLNVFWVPVGWVARLLALSPPVAFHLARLAMVPLFTVVAYVLSALIFRESARRKVALVFVAFASGLGGYFALPLEGQFPKGVSPMTYPMDLWVTEAFPFLQFHQTGHFTFGTILFVLVLAGIAIAWRTGQYRYSLGAGVAALWLFAFHPFHAPSLAAIIVVWGLWEGIRRRVVWTRLLTQAMVVAAIAAPAFAWQYVVATTNPIGVARAAQNVLPTPALHIVLESYGLLAVAATVMFFRRSTWRHDRRSLLALWILAQGVSIFLPFFFQRRLTQGLSIPLALLTADLAVDLLERWQRRPKSFAAFVATSRAILVFAFVVLFGFSNAIVLGQDIHFVLTNRTAPFVMYLPNEYATTFDVLKRTAADAIVLARAGTGNVLPGFTGRRTYVGHPVETLEYEMKRRHVETFFRDEESPERQAAFLDTNKISHVFWGPLERSTGSFDPKTKSFLEPVSVGQTISLYRVKRPAAVGMTMGDPIGRIER